MTKRKIIGLMAVLFMSIAVAKGQDISALKLMQKIDSVARVKQINTAELRTRQVGSFSDKTATEEQVLAKKGSFRFDGPFLVIADLYFNVNKLLYFKIKERSFIFYFQGY